MFRFSAPANCRPKSCSHTVLPSWRSISEGRSSITFTPIFSSIGRLCDSGTGLPR